eukprot:GHVL01039646.1.p1 GENE.GHVL01039646.1~~GHVL01039646.1.p1  ORF type:complete len:146 (-),score=12.54 GHVL01039646.1:196-633(-)
MFQEQNNSRLQPLDKHRSTEGPIYDRDFIPTKLSLTSKYYVNPSDIVEDETLHSIMQPAPLGNTQNEIYLQTVNASRFSKISRIADQTTLSRTASLKDSEKFISFAILKTISFDPLVIHADKDLFDSIVSNTIVLFIYLYIYIYK